MVSDDDSSQPEGEWTLSELTAKVKRLQQQLLPVSLSDVAKHVARLKRGPTALDFPSTNSQDAATFIPIDFNNGSQIGDPSKLWKPYVKDIEAAAATKEKRRKNRKKQLQEELFVGLTEPDLDNDDGEERFKKHDVQTLTFREWEIVANINHLRNLSFVTTFSMAWAIFNSTKVSPFLTAIRLGDEDMEELRCEAFPTESEWAERLSKALVHAAKHPENPTTGLVKAIGRLFHLLRVQERGLFTVPLALSTDSYDVNAPLFWPCNVLVQLRGVKEHCDFIRNTLEGAKDVKAPVTGVLALRIVRVQGFKPGGTNQVPDGVIGQAFEDAVKDELRSMLPAADGDNEVAAFVRDHIDQLDLPLHSYDSDLNDTIGNGLVLLTLFAVYCGVRTQQDFTLAPSYELTTNTTVAFQKMVRRCQEVAREAKKEKNETTKKPAAAKAKATIKSTKSSISGGQRDDHGEGGEACPDDDRETDGARPDNLVAVAKKLGLDNDAAFIAARKGEALFTFHIELTAARDFIALVSQTVDRTHNLVSTTGTSTPPSSCGTMESLHKWLMNNYVVSERLGKFLVPFWEKMGLTSWDGFTYEDFFRCAATSTTSPDSEGKFILALPLAGTDAVRYLRLQMDVNDVPILVEVPQAKSGALVLHPPTDSSADFDGLRRYRLDSSSVNTLSDSSYGLAFLLLYDMVGVPWPNIGSIEDRCDPEVTDRVVPQAPPSPSPSRKRPKSSPASKELSASSSRPKKPSGAKKRKALDRDTDADSYSDADSEHGGGAGSNHKKKKKKKKKKKDPNAPKGVTSAFMYFSKAKRSEVKDSNQDLSSTDISKELGKMWGLLDADGKKPYNDLAAEDKERHKREMAEYKAKEAGEADNDDE